MRPPPRGSCWTARPTSGLFWAPLIRRPMGCEGGERSVWQQLPIHILLTLGWMALWGSSAWWHAAAGAVVGGAILYALTKGTGQPFYLKRVAALVKFVIVFLWELIMAANFVVRISTTPKPRHRPGIVALPLRLKTDATITALTHLLSLT